MNKYDHVREAKAEGRAGGHHCHWPECPKEVPAAMWGCSRHWYMLPPRIRARIWAAYRPGQEATKRPTADYIDAAKEAQEWIAVNPDPKLQQGSLL